MEFECSVCKYTSDRKANVKTHIINRCVNALINEIKIDINCEFCKKSFSTKPILVNHLKICKVKKINLEEENKKLKEEITKINSNVNTDIQQKYDILQKKHDILQKKHAKLEESYHSIIKLTDKKVLGNTNISTIRNQSRKKYKEYFNNMKCVHCKHNGSTQVCHIKAISDYNETSTIDEINHISNLIGLCPNCHIDLDKHRKFEVMRTATLHSMIMKKIKPIE